MSTFWGTQWTMVSYLKNQIKIKICGVLHEKKKVCRKESIRTRLTQFPHFYMNGPPLGLVHFHLHSCKIFHQMGML